MNGFITDVPGHGLKTTRPEVLSVNNFKAIPGKYPNLGDRVPVKTYNTLQENDNAGW
jgi:hypothetical protein